METDGFVGKRLGGVLCDGGEYFQIFLHHSRLHVARLRLFHARWPPLDGLVAKVVLDVGGFDRRLCKIVPEWYPVVVIIVY